MTKEQSTGFGKRLDLGLVWRSEGEDRMLDDFKVRTLNDSENVTALTKKKNAQTAI